MVVYLSKAVSSYICMTSRWNMKWWCRGTWDGSRSLLEGGSHHRHSMRVLHAIPTLVKNLDSVLRRRYLIQNPDGVLVGISYFS